MKSLLALIPLLLCGWPGAARAQLEMTARPEPLRVFPGAAQPVPVVFHNPGTHRLELEIRTRLFQSSAGSAILLSEKSWKKLQVLPGQTILETTPFDFPVVKAETTFIAQWLDGAGRLAGRMEVMVYPTNLLEELRPMIADESVGIYDPQNQIKPLLKKLKIAFADLEISGLENFSGPLAIVGPFQSKAQMGQGLGRRLKALSKKATAIVWLQPPPEKRDDPRPSFYPVLEKPAAIVVAQPELTAHLVENPQAQLNLIYLCKLALNPQILPHLDLASNF